MLKTIIRVTAFMALIACPVTAQQTRIQSPAEFLGYPLGERFTDHAGVVRYMEALAVEFRRELFNDPHGRPILAASREVASYRTR